MRRTLVNRFSESLLATTEPPIPPRGNALNSKPRTIKTKRTSNDDIVELLVLRESVERLVHGRADVRDVHGEEDERQESGESRLHCE
jgi:hypothetical protein